MAGPYLGLYHKMGSMTPLTATLPFNRDCIGQTFEPAKRGGALPDRRGHWLVVQDQGLVVSNDNHELALPFGDAPAGFEVAAKQALLLGTWRSACLAATSKPAGASPNGKASSWWRSEENTSDLQ